MFKNRDTERELLQSGYRYALSLTHNEPDAEDLVQEAYLKLYAQKGSRLNKALFFTAIRNLYIDHYRRTQLVVFEALDEDIHGDVDLQSEIDVASKDLDAALGKLKAEEREALYLNAVEGYTAREIAELTNRSRNTVLSHIHRAKKKLVQTLNAAFKRRKYL